MNTPYIKSYIYEKRYHYFAIIDGALREGDTLLQER